MQLGRRDGHILLVTAATTKAGEGWLPTSHMDMAEVS